LLVKLCRKSGKKIREHERNPVTEIFRSCLRLCSILTFANPLIILLLTTSVTFKAPKQQRVSRRQTGVIITAFRLAAIHSVIELRNAAVSNNAIAYTGFYLSS
jgi:hypothetical protein